MYKIVKRQQLNDTVVRLDVQAPFIAKKAKAGQFIIFRMNMVSVFHLLLLIQMQKKELYLLFFRLLVNQQCFYHSYRKAMLF